MAGRNQRDVALVIKARDEATKTFDAVADALQNLVESQSELGSGTAGTQNRLSQFTNILLALDKAAGDVSTRFDAASNSVAQMQQRAAANTTRFDELTREAQSLTRVVELLAAESDKAFIGPRRNGLTDALRSAKTDLNRLNGEISSLSSAITRDLQGVAGSTSPLQQLAMTERAVADASALARASIEQETKALHDLEAQAKALTPLQARINGVTGVDRPDATGSASAAAPVLALADAQFKVTEARNAEIQKLKQQEAATASLAREQEAQKKASTFLVDTGSGKSARESAQVFADAETEALKQAEAAHKAFEDRVKQGVAAMQAEDAAVARLRSELDPTAAIMARAAAEQAKLNDWVKRGKITDIEAAQAKKLLEQATKDTIAAQKQANANTPKVSLFGLRPYETQNLLFQVNDIFTQLSSGASISQTLAQQGGQIFQIFQNRVGPAIAAAFSNPFFLGAAAVLGTFVVGLVEANAQLERMRTFNADIAANADGGFYDVQALEASTKALDRYGLSAEQALNAVRELARNNVAEDQIVAFGVAAKNLSDTLGTDLDAAVKQVATSFTKGFEAVDKLDQSMNFLTAAQREHIQTLFEEGRAGEARAEAFRIFSERQEDAARKSRGPWSEAARALGNAWDTLIGAIANSAPIRATIAAFDDLADSITTVLNRLSGFRDLEQIRRDIRAINNEAAVLRASDLSFDPFGIKAKRIKELQEQLKKLLEEEKAAIAAGSSGATGVPKDTVNVDSEQQRKADQRIAEAAQERLAREKQISNEKRIQLAIDKAAREAADAGASAAGISQAKATAEAEERAKIAKETAAAEKSAASERERAIQQFNSRVIGAEGGGGKNPFSTAQGFGQFINGTWLEQFKKVFGDQAKDLTNAQILSLRNNQTIAKAIIDNYARENARFLESFGAKVTAGNLYLAHFLGPDKAKRVLQADSGTPVDQLLSQDVINRNKGYLMTNGRARTAGELRDFIAKRVGDTGAAQSAGEVEISKLLEENKQRQDDFNASVEKGNQDRQESINALTAEKGLMGEQLIAAQRKAAMDKAESDLRQKVADANKNLKPGETEIVLTEEQIKKTRELTAAQFDLAHAKDVAAAKRAAVDNPVADLTAQRDAIQQQIEFAQRAGDNSPMAALEASLVSVNEKLKEAQANQLAFYEAIAAGGEAARAEYGLTAEALQAIIDKINAAAASQPNLQTQFLMTGKQINETFAAGAANAFDQFAQKVAAGENVMKSLKQAFLQFASDFLRQIAQMIIKQAIFNAIGGATGSGGGGLGGGIAGAIGGLFKHDGGRLGGGRSRAINPAVFVNAMRLHSGGVPGLGPNEVPTILERDEEVLTRSDPRHILNGGKNAKGAAPVIKVEPKIVNAIDAGDAMSKGLDTRVGQQAFLNFITANREAVKQSLG